ncbi:serine hydrolase [Actinospica durhamensis]|uniref:Serine hydrolase n=1 Tax=Actinospica durhamensis TaxID=1508375 RepID=A0A941ET89_9ACTN|nr:serine hydrolase [Actinospica durhamensis]MBR7836058.1 serine hydrolase [Actinospica durhamensis]
MAGTVSADDKNVSVAVEDLSSGTTAGYNVTDDYVTASIVKLDILSTLLYDHQKDGTSMTSDERDLATKMIENSDNDAASALYDDVGGSSAIEPANRVFGLTDTEVDDSAFGDTTTTATDQVKLLRQVFTSDSVLTSANRSYIQNLMSHVETDQRWGVSAAADDTSSSADDYMLKNGWLPRSATDLWEINSIGEVQHDGHTYLVAVLSAQNSSMDSGIDVIQKVAKEAVDALG